MTIHELRRMSCWDGEPFDFGSHVNEFLVRREDALASETFLVRIPAGKATPIHTHPDMEQTFVILSGSGEVTGDPDPAGEPLVCHPGDLVHIPLGTPHSVRAPSLVELSYVCVNSFAPHVQRDGSTSLAHAQGAARGFEHTSAAGDAPPPPTLPSPRSLLDASELRVTHDHPSDGDARMAARWASVSALALPPAATASSHRVATVGPFELLLRVEPTPQARLSYTALGELAAHLPVAQRVRLLVAGSQSPLSVKLPHPGSDLDLLLVPDNSDDGLDPPGLIALASELEATLRSSTRTGLGGGVSVGVALVSWLRLPGFYEAVEIGGPQADHWWKATPEEVHREIARRLRQAVVEAAAPSLVHAILADTIAAFKLGQLAGHVETITLTPRWHTINPDAILRRAGV